MKKLLSLSLIASASLLANHSHANASNIWQDVLPQNMSSKAVENTSTLKYRKLTVAHQQLAYELSLAPLANAGVDGIVLDIPLPDGSYAKYRIVEKPVLPEDMASKYPDIKTYQGFDINKPAYTGSFDLTPDGFHGMLSRGANTVYIDPDRNNEGRYFSFYKKDYQGQDGSESKPHFKCDADDHNHSDGVQWAEKFVKKAESNDGKNRTYRLAVAATGEYTQNRGGKAQAISSIATAVSRLNQIYNNDLGVNFVLANNNDNLVYTDPETDPFTNDPGGDIENITGRINLVIGSSAYDLGHLVGTGDGGIAGLGVLCSTLQKGAGATGTSNPVGDPFVVDYLAHEIGHQLGSEHSFNGTAGSCGTRAANFAYEPGSGSTIMAYAGICADENLQNNSDAYFHSTSIDQMYAIVKSASCGTVTNSGNNNPVVDASQHSLKTLSIPRQTPFALTGQATDADPGHNASLLYLWEQVDLGAETSSKATFTDDGSRPLFRSFTPTTNATRTFPQLSDVLSGEATYGEIMANTQRDLKFRLTVKDTHGGLANDSLTLKVRSGCPFKVAEPVSNVNLRSGTLQRVKWHVADTASSPISCPNVDIHLSTDGGQNFSTALKTNVANDGVEDITLPNITTNNARLRVSCSNNVFFAVTPVNFRISNTGETTPSDNTAPAPQTGCGGGVSNGGSSSSSGGGTMGGSSLLLLIGLLALRKTASTSKAA